MNKYKSVASRQQTFFGFVELLLTDTQTDTHTDIQGGIKKVGSQTREMSVKS